MSYFTAKHPPAPWLRFKRPHVRDLAYVICCPPVYLFLPKQFADYSPRNLLLPDTRFWRTHYENYLPRLNQLENDPKPLNIFLAKNLKSLRLGFRFEGLLLFWLLDNKYHPYELLAHSVQIFDGDVTKSELDFIVKNNTTNEVEHWEVAVKFFLGESPFSPAHWKGLKGTDNLQKKTLKTLTNPFSHDSVVLASKTVKIDKRVAIIKGRFYEPKHQLQELQRAKLPWLNPQLPRGKWYNRIPLSQPAEENLWRNGRRAEWMTQRDCYNLYDLGSHEKQLLTHINEAKTPQRKNPLLWQTGLFFHAGEHDDLQQTNSQQTNTQQTHALQEQAVMLRLPDTPQASL